MCVVMRVCVFMDKCICLSVCNVSGHVLAFVYILKTLSPCKFLSVKQRRILMQSFIESQFSYWPLIWMSHGSGVNKKINDLHERSLRIVSKDNNSLKT